MHVENCIFSQRLSIHVEADQFELAMGTVEQNRFIWPFASIRNMA